jgi:hypothetical protein
MDESQLAALYQQYLGRAPDPSGIATWLGQDPSAVIAGITGSPEYQASHPSNSGNSLPLIAGPEDITYSPIDGGSGSPAPAAASSADLNSLYQQYLGRNVDPSGAATWAGQSPEAIIAGITGSPEYQASHGGGGGAPAGGNAQDLASQVFNLYATNQNYDQQLNALNAISATDPAAFYNARIGLLGKQMGWQIGQNTGDRNSVYQNELNSLIPGALAAGMTQDQINQLISTNSASASQQNENRIAQDAASGAGSGWVNQNIPGGYATLGAAAALVAAPYLAPELFAGEGALGTGMVDASGNIIGAGTEGAAVGTGAGAGAGAAAATGAATDIANAAPEVNSALDTANATLPSIPGTTPATTSTFGTMTAPLTGSGAVPGAGALTTGATGTGALTGALPAGVMVGDGTLGTTIGATYMAAGPGQFAVDALGNAIPASSVGIDGFAPSTSILNSLPSLSSLQPLLGPLSKLLGGSGSASSLLGGLTGNAKPTTTSGLNSGSDITNLSPGLTQGNENYTLTGMPSITESSNPVFSENLNQQAPVMHAKTGGSATSSNSPSLFDDNGGYNYSNINETTLTPVLTKHNVGYTLTGLPSFNKAEGGSIGQFADGGEVHTPEFYSEGGASMANRYVQGKGDGTSDSIPAMLANGEFVIPADVVSNLGNGSNDSGAKILDEFLRVIRKHKRKANEKHLPPDSKGALSYLTDAKRKVKA